MPDSVFQRVSNSTKTCLIQPGSGDARDDSSKKLSAGMVVGNFKTATVL
jgi:hypothetical protein